MSKFSYHKTSNGSMKLWDSHGAFEPEAMQQLENVANMPFIHKHIAGMPDVHLGRCATIGSVIATKGVIYVSPHSHLLLIGILTNSLM